MFAKFLNKLSQDYCPSTALASCFTVNSTEFAIKQSLWDFLCNSFAFKIICSSVTVTIGINITSVNRPPPLGVSIMVPV